MLDKMRAFKTLNAAERSELADWATAEAVDAHLIALDAEDGGYDWGPEGPPQGIDPADTITEQRGRHED